jgi:hypothetical protein
MTPSKTYRHYESNRSEADFEAQGGEQETQYSSPLPAIDESEIATAFDQTLHSSTFHYFIDIDDSKPRAAEEIAAFESTEANLYSIT